MNAIVKEEIHEALELLEEAAKDTAEELWTLIKDQYPNLQEKLLDNVDSLRDSIDFIQDGVRGAASQIKESSGRKVRYAASQIDEEIHHRPWHYIGGIAVSALLLGYILGRKTDS